MPVFCQSIDCLQADEPMKRGDGYSVINGKPICYGCQEEDSWAAESDYQNAADFDLNRY